MLSPIQKWTYNIFNPTDSIYTSQEKLQEENNALRIQLAKYKELETDNKALHDQFAITSMNPKELIPTEVIGLRDNKMVLDKGSDDSVKQGDIVLLKDNLIGSVTKVSPHQSVVTVITHPSTSFTAITTKTKAIGVVKSQGSGSIFLDNVVLADKLEQNDLVITKGDVTENGFGFPPNLVVGKIISVNKKDSNLFQQAKIRSLLDFSQLRTVFIKKS